MWLSCPTRRTNGDTFRNANRVPGKFRQDTGADGAVLGACRIGVVLHKPLLKTAASAPWRRGPGLPGPFWSHVAYVRDPTVRLDSPVQRYLVPVHASKAFAAQQSSP
jgi:hypothetical protein